MSACYDKIDRMLISNCHHDSVLIIQIKTCSSGCGFAREESPDKVFSIARMNWTEQVIQLML